MAWNGAYSAPAVREVIHCEGERCEVAERRIGYESGEVEKSKAGLMKSG